MKKIDKRVHEVLNRGEKLLVSGVPIGYPDLDTSRRIVEKYINSGIDIVEFSMPSQNPYIDTEVIAKSNKKALNLEPNFDRYFDTMLKIREDFPNEPFYMMAYEEIIRECGVEHFVELLNKIGVDALELPDKEERNSELVTKLDTLLDEVGIYRIYFLQHPFNNDYFLKIKNVAQGFVLLQSYADKLGERNEVAIENKMIIESMRNSDFKVPIILGYGINKAERVREAVRVGADGVIVGTAMIRKITEGDFDSLSRFIHDLKEATLP